MTFSLRRNSRLNLGARRALVTLPAFGIYLLVTVFVSAEEGDDLHTRFEKCRVIGDDQARLTCLKDLLPKKVDEPDRSAAGDPWPLVRIPHPRGGSDAVSIMRTADTTRSDPDLAGLMIRCAEKQGLDAILALVRPAPPRSKRDVVVAAGVTQVLLHAEVTSAGTALLLPVEPAIFTKEPWRSAQEIAVTIRDPDGEIRGVIPLDGISPAMAKLSANCPPR
jgi:hypothetical protein